MLMLQILLAAPLEGHGWGMPHDASLDGWRIDDLINETSAFVILLFAIMVAWMLWAAVRHGERHPARFDHGTSRRSIAVALSIAAAIFFVVDGHLFLNSIVVWKQVFGNFAWAEAQPGAPGIAPLRVEDYYAAPFPGMYTPGVPPQVVSVVAEEDWSRLATAVEEARAAADVVVASMHWGDHTRPWVLTDAERTCAQLLVEAGADVVLGHHHHLPRGVELLDGKPVFYGLGHAVFDQPRFGDELRRRGIDLDAMDDDERAAAFGEWAVYPRRVSPSFPFHPLYRRSVVAVVELDDAEVVRAGVAPLLIGEDGIARPIARRDPGWAEALDFLARCQAEGGLATELRDAGWTHGGCDLLTATA